VPLVMFTACSLYTIVPLSRVQATRYRMLVDGSITGVLRMPRLPTNVAVAREREVGVRHRHSADTAREIDPPQLRAGIASKA